MTVMAFPALGGPAADGPGGGLWAAPGGVRMAPEEVGTAPGGVWMAPAAASGVGC